MSTILRRYHAHAEHIQDEQKLARILLQTGNQAPTIGHATAGGDERKLRGIPAIARGVAGAVTIPIGRHSTTLGSDAHLDSIQ